MPLSTGTDTSASELGVLPFLEIGHNSNKADGDQRLILSCFVVDEDNGMLGRGRIAMVG